MCKREIKGSIRYLIVELCLRRRPSRKKSKEPVIRKLSQIFKNIIMTDERDDNKSGTTDTKTGKNNACYKKVKKNLK